MRLFLSSQNIGNYPKVFYDLAGDNKKLAYIGYAKDDWAVEDRQAKTSEHKQQFVELGFDFYEIDLRKYFGKQNNLRETLANFGSIWVSGGNTFFLRKAFAYSGLDEILVDMVGQDKVAYGGSSAGSIIVTPSLRGTEHGDNPEVVPHGYKNEIIWEGLNLVPFYVVPHYQSDWWGKEANLMIEYLKSKNLEYYALKDGQAVLVNGNKEEFLK